MYEEYYNHHYIMTRDDNVIIDAWSDGPHPEKDPSKAICINNKGGYQFRLSPSGEENPNMYNMDGIPLYKWDGENVVMRSTEEIEVERAAIPLPPPTAQEQLRADVDFLLCKEGLI